MLNTSKPDDKSGCALHMSASDASACRSLLDSRLLPAILQHLPPDAVGRLACTCRAFRSLVNGEALSLDWWQSLASERLYSGHPVLHPQSKPASQVELRTALCQYKRARKQMQMGQYTQSGRGTANLW
ncbi:hypothetical protein WJX73_010051 [Symbiochloris irregularis]|uniref:F-box domain-containing protein n=1 Tax=Symbiochloris irregularis TaxID=706552 RepID=A0AAW1P3W4_9CHLO